MLRRAAAVGVGWLLHSVIGRQAPKSLRLGSYRWSDLMLAVVGSRSRRHL